MSSITNGAEVIVSSGAVASGAVVTALGLLLVTSGGQALSTLVGSGGGLGVLAGGVASQTGVQSGGLAAVLSGGSASDIGVASGGTLAVYAGGSVTSASFGLGAELDLASVPFVSGGQAVLNAGTLAVTVGGVETDLGIVGVYAGDSFVPGPDGAGGTALILAPTVASITPVITGVMPDTGVSASDGITDAARIKVVGTGLAGASVAVSFDGFQLATVTVTGAGTWSADLSGIALGNGAGTLVAVETDPGANQAASSAPYAVTIASGAPNIAVPLVTPGGDFLVGTADDLVAAPRPIAAPVGLFNTLVIQGDGTLTDGAFSGVSHVQGITMNGTGASSLSLGANAAAMAGGFVAVSVPNAASYTVNDGGSGGAPLYLLGGSGHATVIGSNGGDYLVFGGGLLNVSEGAGDDYINVAGNEIALAGTSINGGGGYNRLVMAGSNTITDANLAGVSNVQELDFSGTGAQSVVLGAHAQAMAGSQLTVYTATAGSMVVDGSALTTTGLTVTDAGGGADTMIAGRGGAYFTGGGGADQFMVGLGGTDYISDFVPGLDRITLQAGGFSTLAQVTAATAQYGASGFDISTGGGAHVVVLGVAFTALHAADFGLGS